MGRLCQPALSSLVCGRRLWRTAFLLCGVNAISSCCFVRDVARLPGPPGPPSMEVSGEGGQQRFWLQEMS
jgi:hypothetical protein